MSTPKDLRDRVGDAQSRRRRLLGGEDRKAFDQHYGEQKGTRSKRTGAGKGDAARTNTNDERYQIGHRLATEKDIPDGERLELERRWYALGGRPHPDDV